MANAALIFDIETIADVTSQNREAIAALANDREITADEYGALCPPLARVVCIAWLDVTARKLGAFFDTTLAAGPWPTSIDVAAEADSIRPCDMFGCAGEAEMLRAFGRKVEQHLGQANGHLATYNGRGFDLPVLIHRAIKHGITEGRELLIKAVTENRFRPLMHIDLMDSVTFYGASNRWPMAAYAVGYGWRSPKQDLSGAHVAAAVHAGRILEVVRYCAGDVLATACVYEKIVASQER